jgi:outer membrane protein assembly factor BamB
MSYPTEVDPARTIIVVAIMDGVRGIHVSNGQIAWRTPVDGGPAFDLAIYGSLVLVAGSQEGSRSLHCLDYSTGRIFWSARTTDTGRTQTLVDGPYIYVARGGTIDCFDLDGRGRWTANIAPVDQLSFGFPGHVRLVDARGRIV